MARLLLLNGPNLNLLGTREPALYGPTSLQTIEQRAMEMARAAGHELIGRLHAAPADGVQFIIFNPGAFTHTSIALRDALLAIGLPFIEIHVSNVDAREPFRRHSYFSDVAAGVISGFGTFGYELAVVAALRGLGQPGKPSHITT